MAIAARPSSKVIDPGSVWGGLVSASARRADGLSPEDGNDSRTRNGFPPAGDMSRTLSELEASIAALNERVAQLSENDDKARKLALQLGMDTVQMGSALSRRLRQLEQRVTETPAAPVSAVELQPVAEIETTPADPAHEVEEAPHLIETAPTAELPHMADEPHLAEETHSFETSGLSEAPQVIPAPLVAEEPLTLETPPSPIFAPEDVAPYPLLAPETTSSELFAPRTVTTKKAPFPVVTLSVVGAVLLALILAAAWFMLGHGPAPATTPAAPPPAPTAESAPAPVKAAEPKAAPAPAPKASASQDSSSDSDRHSGRSGRHHHDGRGSSGRREKGSNGHVLYDITPPAAPAATPAPF